MSLFPAYSVWNTPDQTVSQERNWLSNNSFDAGPSNPRGWQSKKKKVPKKKGNNAKSPTKMLKNKQKAMNYYKKKNQLRRESRESKKCRRQNPIIVEISDECDLYCIDKTKRTDYLCHSTLTRPIKPRYRVYKKNLIGPKNQEPKKEKIRRYFMRKIGMTRSEDKEERAQKENKAIKLNKEFNRRLCKNSSVADWVTFVEFQDEYFVSEGISFRVETDKEAAIKKKKLHILEKGLHFNPGNEELLKYWMKIANETLSTDEMSQSLDKMIGYSPGNLALWFNYISVTQQSLSRCTYSSVTALYKSGINSIKTFKIDDILGRDAKIIELLFHYCKFLQDSGHWEVLWTILKANIRLNFGIDINIDLGITDFRVKKLEDEIICVESQPIWVTWKMVEALREGLHFLPVTESVYYPQRCILLNDLFDFVLHFHPDFHFKLIIKFLILLKVPPLPFNTAISKALYETRSIWTLDSPELILSAAFSAPATGVKIDYLKFVAQVPAGPQYLRALEGQREFLELVQKVFYEFMGVLRGKQKIFVGIWWLRFNRWLCILEKYSLASLRLPAKKMKNFFKDFMKNPENRDNLFYYCEYSLFEFNQGNIEASVKTLKTLISSRRPVHQLTDDLEKAALCHVYRSLSELYIEIGQKEEARKVLIHLALGLPPDTRADTLKLALNKYEDDMFDLIKEIGFTSDSLEQILIPQFSLEWIHCYLWLLALSESATCAKTLYLRLDLQLKQKDKMFSNYAREYLCEAVATIFWTVERDKPLTLAHILKDGLIQYPENLKMLSLLASKKIEDHGLWLTFKQSFINPPTIFGCIFLISVALARRDIDEESFRNRLKSLFRQLATNEGKLSSIIHRLRLMFLFDFDQSQLEPAQVNAVSSCPWNKSVYMSAISVLPNKLMELTDVMIEKELRIHVTPDEIVEMRD